VSVVRLLGLEDSSIDFTFSTNPEKSIDFDSAQKWASQPIPRQEGSILQDMGADALVFKWNGVLDGDNAFSDLIILDGISKQGSLLQFLYAGLAVECVITGLSYKLITPFAGALDRWFYEIKLQRYYPLLGVTRTAADTSSLNGQELPTLTNKLNDLSTQLNAFQQILADIQAGTNAVSNLENEVMQAVGGVENAVSDALTQATETLDTLRQGVQLPAYVLQETKASLDDASTLVKQSISELGSIFNTPQLLTSTLYDMSVSLDIAAAAPFVSTSDVTTVVTEDGDTLEGLSDYFYGSFEAWRVIYAANQALIPDAHTLTPGLTLTVPL
jgi:hypothetical protein